MEQYQTVKTSILSFLVVASGICLVAVSDIDSQQQGPDHAGANLYTGPFTEFLAFRAGTLFKIR